MAYHIVIDDSYKSILEGLIEQEKFKSAKEYTEAMILYFKETGINPQAKNKSTADELSKLRTTVISFIREQEKKKLDPIILKLNETFEFLLNYYKNEAVTKADIKTLMISREQEPIMPIENLGNNQQQIYEEKYQNLVRHVKGLFKDFEKNFKSSTFGGYSIDKAVFEKYKSMFEKL